MKKGICVTMALDTVLTDRSTVKEFFASRTRKMLLTYSMNKYFAIDNNRIKSFTPDLDNILNFAVRDANAVARN